MKSVFEQTWQEFEYIVIDGGSLDGSKGLIEENNARIDYWVSEPDKGIYNAMNKGIEMSTGQYLLFLNSGDHFYNKWALSKSFRYLKMDELVTFDLQVIGKDFQEKISKPKVLRFKDLFYGSLTHPSTFIKRNLFEIVGMYDESLSIVSDWKFFILALYKCNCSYLKIDDTLTTHYLDGISSDPANESIMELERQLVIQNNFKRFLVEFNELSELIFIVKNLKKSRKIALLVKLGLLKKF
jgi:glycosyltransferase involved in cell wall biosynthesis